jgi:hypothetical protein
MHNLEAQQNSLSMALETAKPEDKDFISETELKLSEIEKKLLQLRKCKMQVMEGSCFLIYTVEMSFLLQETGYCHLLLQLHHHILSAVFRIYRCT